jgi:hypothetical protein
LKKPHDIEIARITQKYAYYNLIAQKQLEYSEKIVQTRQKDIKWLESLKRISYAQRKTEVTKTWPSLSDEA